MRNSSDCDIIRALFYDLACLFKKNCKRYSLNNNAYNFPGSQANIGEKKIYSLFEKDQIVLHLNVKCRLKLLNIYHSGRMTNFSYFCSH